MATPEEFVVHYARAWYETERSAMKAPFERKEAANYKHNEAKKALRNAVCRLPGAKDETPDTSKP